MHMYYFVLKSIYMEEKIYTHTHILYWLGSLFGFVLFVNLTQARGQLRRSLPHTGL